MRWAARMSVEPAGLGNSRRRSCTGRTDDAHIDYVVAEPVRVEHYRITPPFGDAIPKAQ
jgi:hypothetical protein